VDTLKGALQKLEQKLDEARSKRDLLLARQRRSLALGKRHERKRLSAIIRRCHFRSLEDRVHHGEAVATAEAELVNDDVGERLHRMERDTEIERLLADLKGRRRLPG